MNALHRQIALLLLVTVTSSPLAAAWSPCCSASGTASSDAVSSGGESSSAAVTNQSHSCCHKAATAQLAGQACAAGGKDHSSPDCRCLEQSPAESKQATAKATAIEVSGAWLSLPAAPLQTASADRFYSDHAPGLLRPVHPSANVLFCVWLK